MFRFVAKYMPRRLLFASGMAAAFAAPAMMFEDSLPTFARKPVRNVKSMFSSQKAASDEAKMHGMDVGGMAMSERMAAASEKEVAATSTNAGGSEPPFAAAAEAALADPQLEGPPVYQLTDVLRFDVSPPWVTHNWSRVSTVLAEMNLMGLRVPLVTGTNPDDLAGSLTYYFDRYHQVQRITLDGYIGDERKLSHLAQQYLQMHLEPSLDAAMFVTRWNGHPTSVLRLAHVPVVRSTMPNARYEFMLEVNRPNLEYGLSQRTRDVLEYNQAIRRWQGVPPRF